MLHKKVKPVILSLILFLFSLLTVGCPPAQEPAPQEPAPQPQEAQEIDITELVTQWVESGHSNITLYAAERDGCVACHDGGAFAQQLTEVAQLERDFHVATDCRACHTGRGSELLQAGTVSIPTQENVEAGTGAQCLACHNERRAPDINDERRAAPHPSSQAGVFTGTGGIRAANFDYQEESPHNQIDNSCVSCHMTPVDAGWASHTFAVDNAEAACGDCHRDITDVNLAAGADYDGDGDAKGFQDEVAGLLSLLEEAISKEINGGSFEAGGGVIKFTNGAGNEIQVPNEVYQAAYNHTLVAQDGSLGLHNPIFVVQLLQQSYRELTGKDVPDADIQ